MTFDECRDLALKERKRGIALSSVFGGLLLVALTLFLVFIDLGNRLLLSVLGSILLVALSFALAYGLYGLLIPGQNLLKLLKSLPKETAIIEGKISSVSKERTIRRGIEGREICLECGEKTEKIFVIGGPAPKVGEEARYVRQGRFGWREKE